MLARGAQCRQGGLVDPLPQRPRHGGGELARRGEWRARARSSAPSTASASAPATPRSRRSSWRCSTRADFFNLETRIDTPQIVPTARLVVDHHRLRGAAQQGGGRRERLRARVRHPPGRRAEGTPRPTRSCARTDVGWTRTGSCSASSRGATPSSSGCRSWASTLASEEALNAAFAALQGPRRQEGRDLRRGHRRRWSRDEAVTPTSRASPARRSAATRDRRAALHARGASAEDAAREARGRAGAARSTRRSRRSRASRERRPSCCSIRSTT